MSNNESIFIESIEEFKKSVEMELERKNRKNYTNNSLYEQLLKKSHVLSGKHVINRGELQRKERRTQEQKLPIPGTYIFYNEIVGYRDLTGNPPHASYRRGVGLVKSYTKDLMLVRTYITPDRISNECFRISDVIIGLFWYQELSDYVYTYGNFSYDDLSCEHPHEIIKKLFLTKEESEKRRKNWILENRSANND